ncbi:MAG: dynamin family protein [Microcoleus vaginatus WJT46-NPBG5]|jgi:uncharacterized tellurite resistance protein B-like protein/GTPase SAR1 family protein|nr:dynamin family protein [Microcoleus vaginatus WJT46-NPBG5]
MDTALVGSEAVELLSRITGQKIRKQDLTPPVIFLAALITVLLRVMLTDGTVTDEEKQRWQKTINRFIPSEGNVRQLAQLMTKGIRQNQVYKKLNDLQTLTAPLSESERLLLISFGYEMSAADGEMDAREKKYLEIIANQLGINPRHLAGLEASFTHQGTVESAALNEVQSLLAPARFHELDTIFVKAASDILAALPTKPEYQGTQQQRNLSYEQLKEFQKHKQQLDNFCYQVLQIIQDCATRGFLPETLTEEIGKVSRKLQSQRFRLAVIGEFSQGKSTLLNALLGQEIQPVREIPCSGTVTVLKYGTQKRVVCRYRNGREEEIPFEQYQEKAAIPEEAALGNLSDELAESEIDEIVFEHPNFDLCSSGVEIIDSPGLNEHPNRTAITQKLLKDIDAVIFLTNASRSLTQGERDLLQDLKSQLNGGVHDKPANNIFVVGNFMDLVRTEKGREQVQQRINRFVQGQNPIVAGENRVHFISAQSSLNAILKGIEDEYQKSFESFTQSIEKFLTIERGSLEIKQSVTKINDLIQSSFDGLHQAEEILDGKISLSEADQCRILEQIGEASGRDIRIRLLANQLVDEVIEEVNTSWDMWVEGLGERIAEKAKHWSSEHNAILSRDELILDYAIQYGKDLKTELDDWIENQLKQAILIPNLETFVNKIRQELTAIKSDIEELTQQVNALSPNWIFYGWIFYGEEKNYLAAIGILGELGLAGLGSLVGGGLANFLGNNSEIKAKVIEVGREKFAEYLGNTFENINKIIGSSFDGKVEQAEEIIAKAISFYENLLEQQEKTHKETWEQREADKAWISQKRQELEQVQKNIELSRNTF